MYMNVLAKIKHENFTSIQIKKLSIKINYFEFYLFTVFRNTGLLPEKFFGGVDGRADAPATAEEEGFAL